MYTTGLAVQEAPELESDCCRGRSLHVLLRSEARTLLRQPTTKDFNVWLTEISDEDLDRLLDCLEPTLDGTVKDQEAFTYILSLILRFCGKDALSTEEITSLLLPIATCLALEVLRRRGTVVKQGRYSLITGEDDALFTLTYQKEDIAGE